MWRVSRAFHGKLRRKLFTAEKYVERATEIKVRAERRAGQMLGDIERSKGGRGKTEAGVAQVYRDNEIPPTTGKRWQKLAAVPEDQSSRYR